jgi:hypothetical protein
VVSVGWPGAWVVATVRTRLDRLDSGRPLARTREKTGRTLDRATPYRQSTDRADVRS